MKNFHIELEQFQRYLEFPLPVKKVVHRLRNAHILEHSQMESIFLCFVFSRENKQINVTNQKISIVPLTPQATMGIVWPGTVIDTLVPSVKHELFFEYDRKYLPEFQKFNFHVCQFKLNPNINYLLNRIDATLLEIHRPGAPDQLDVLAVDLAMAAMLSAKITQNEEQPCSNDNIFTIAAYLELHFDEKIDMNQLLKKYHYTRRSFYREWNRQYPVTPMQYLINLRLTHAANLLKNSNLKIYEIAQECGFATPMHFSSSFTKRYQCPPGEYRRMDDEQYRCGN